MAFNGSELERGRWKRGGFCSKHNKRCTNRSAGEETPIKRSVKGPNEIRWLESMVVCVWMLQRTEQEVWMGEKHAFVNDVIETGRSEMPLSEKMAFTVIDENSMQAQFSSNKTAALQKTGERHAHNASHRWRTSISLQSRQMTPTYEMC